MPRYLDTDVGGFVITAGEASTSFGPFDTPNEAGQWAVKNLPLDAAWVIRPFLDPGVAKPQHPGGKPHLRIVRGDD